MMTEKIAHLRALLLDEGWSEDHRAAALKTLAEIDAAWDALLAPVDVEAVAREARARYRDRGAFAGSSEASQVACWVEAVSPIVQDRERAKAWARGERAARREVARMYLELRRAAERACADPANKAMGDVRALLAPEPDEGPETQAQTPGEAWAVSECVCDEGRRARASEARTWTCGPRVWAAAGRLLPDVRR